MRNGLRSRVSLAAASLALGCALAAGCSDGIDPSAQVDEESGDGGVTPVIDGSSGADGSRPPADASDDALADAGDAASDGAADASDGGDAGDASDASDAGDAEAGPPPCIDVYDPNTIPTFELTVDAAGMAVLASTAEADKKKWVHATFKSGTTVLADVGLRRKGSSTFRAIPQKAAFKIKFDKYVAGQRFECLKELTLNNMTSDPTFLAERLAYHVFRSAGLPAPKANTAAVSLNGDSYGIYSNVETPNEQFLDRVLGAGASTLYEVQYGSEWLPGLEDGADVQVGDDARADLTALYATVQSASSATLLADVAGKLDTAAWLKHSAAEAAVGHYDGYAFGIWGSHNYYLAGDTAGVFRLVPWSTDLTFSDREGVVDAANPRPADPMAGGDTLLVRCKASPTCWTAYKDAVQAMLVKVESLDLVNLAKAWHAQIDALVVADPKREATLGEYASETQLLYAWIAARPGVVRAQLGLP